MHKCKYSSRCLVNEGDVSDRDTRSPLTLTAVALMDEARKKFRRG